MSRRTPFTTRRILLASLLMLGACQTPAPIDPVRELTVLYTNDEHGWMEGLTPGVGAANLYGLWQEQEGYTPDGPFLILSGGDNWTGPAVSTWTQGESMVEVMNAMHYTASAVGNHEFDFGLDVLRQRASEAKFPYLSANTRWRDSGEVPMEMGIQPYTIVEVNGLRVGIIGLTTTSTYHTTLPTMITDLEFADYEESLRRYAGEVREQGVDMLFVIAHVCMVPLHQLAARVADLNIQLMGGGHCNELEASRVGDTILLNGGRFLASYARASYRYDTANDVLEGVEYSAEQNFVGIEDVGITGIVQKWLAQTEEFTAAFVGFNPIELERSSETLRQAIIDSWLILDPTADVALTNVGGIRSPLPFGDITVGIVMGILPFDNTIIAVNLTGAELRQILQENPNLVVAGVKSGSDGQRLQKNGETLQDATIYRVLVNSFMYAGGDSLDAIATFDPEGFDTGINYRQPFIDWLSSQNSVRSRPLQF